MVSHYKILQLDPSADAKSIKAVYYALAEEHDDDPAMLNKLRLSYEILSDVGKREEYDRKLKKPTGKIVGCYKIISKIAEGGFGTTYKAEHLTLGTPVCIKHASNVSISDEELLMDEARSIWDLRHYGIPAIRDIIRMPDDSLALVMSYVEGKNLAQIREEHYTKGIDPEHVAWITERLLNILKYLHFHGVVHGDVKPANVIIQPESHTVVLVDYGLSLVRPTKKSEAKGYTPLYAAPEQLLGKVLVPGTDFFGLGMTMIYALGGDVEHVKVPSTTPEGMCAFIKKLIKRDVNSRPNWKDENLFETIQQVRLSDFGRTDSGMKPLKV